MEKRRFPQKSTFREQEKQQMKIRRSFVQRDLPCKRTGNFNEHLTDAEIMRAIRYLDRDVCAERTGEDAGTILGFFITFVAALIAALAYIWLYTRML